MYPNKIAFKLSLFALLLITNLNAQESNEAIKLQKVVVSTTGFEQDADSNLRNVISIEGKDLQNKGYISLEQALERISGISFVNFGLGRNIDMRGQGDKSNIAVKVMIDGRAINVLDNSHGVTQLDSINLDNVERIEIIPGGGSVLYGSGTRGGVINIITKKQKSDAFAINLKSSAYDHGRLGGNLGINGAKQINENLAFSFDIQSFNLDGYQEGYNEKGYFINTKTYIDINDNSDLTLGYNYFKSKNTSSGYLTKAQAQSDPTQKGNSDNITQINRPEISLDYHYYFDDIWEFNLEAFWQNQKINYLKDVSTMSSMGLSVPVYQNGSGFEDTLTGISLKNKLNYANNSYFIFGYEFANHDAKRKSLVYYSVPSVINYHRMTTLMDMTKQSHSIFALDSHNFNEFFTLSGGARYEFSSYNTDRSYRNEMSMNGRPPSPTIIDSTTLFDTNKNANNFAFEITPNFKYSDTGKLYIKYERGFVSPNPAQFVNKDKNSQKYYSANLNPEIFDTFELGIDDFWWNFYGFNLTLFYTLSKDEISYLGNPHSTSGSWWKYYNIDQTRRLGVELSLSQNFLDDDLIFRESLTYLDAKISKGVNDGMRIPYVSKIKATAGIEYAWNKNFSNFIDLTYFSRAKDGGTIDENTGKMSKNSWIRDYFLTDIGMKYNYKKLQILAGIRNLFDKRYYTYQDSINDQYLVGNGRNYYVELNTHSKILVIIGLLVAYIIASFTALCLGDENLNPKELFSYIFSQDEILRQIIIDGRLPRIIMAILIGMLLASSGAITQNVFSNPIADPYIIGIASAATFGAVLAYLLKLNDYYYGILGFVCSAFFALGVFKISSKASIATLLIIGIAASSFLGAFTSFFTYLIGEDSFKIVAWLMGNIGNASWFRVGILILPLIFCLFYFYAHKNELNILLSGDDEARNLGVNAQKLKINLLIVSSLAVSFAVAFSGLIGFVGLIIPHTIRLLLKNYDNALVIPLCTAFGGLFLLICDTLARTLLAPVQIPIGILTAFFGAPIFLYLALSARRFL
ncbi:TPA: TonB-dependent receptor [Campylobacter jejuni]|nr:TonB-dependent receptor [Campylobacter jejuni]